MRKLPFSVGMMVFGMLWAMVGWANGWVVISTVASLAVFAGFLWFSVILDKIIKILSPLKSYYKQTRRIKATIRDQEDYRNLKDKSVERKISRIEKATRQSNKGFVLIKPKKEETA